MITSLSIAPLNSLSWLGVEWDTPGRGKHDGSCVDKAGEMHRYFTCMDRMGSFVKPAKVKRGRSFVEVLRERYVELDAPVTAPGNIVPDAFVNTAKGGGGVMVGSALDPYPPPVWAYVGHPYLPPFL